MIKPKASRRDSLNFSNFGFSTILLSFVMICVVCFSALSLLSAYSDYKLSQKVATKTAQYYEAKGKAYESLNELDKFLCNVYLFSESETDYYQTICEELELELQFETDTPTFSFIENIADGHYLYVEAAICYPKQSSDPFYEIIQWRSVYNTQAPEEEYLNLIE